MSERVHKSILNAEVNIFFYFITLFLAFFSRKIFLDCLGTEFIGLTGTLGNILGYLNLAELGITACIGYFLFPNALEIVRHLILGNKYPMSVRFHYATPIIETFIDKVL